MRPGLGMIRPRLLVGEPGVARVVAAGVVGIEIDEAALDLPVADLEHVAPAAGTMFGHAGAPGPVATLAVRAQVRRWIPKARTLAGGGWRELVPRDVPELWRDASTAGPDA